MKRQVFTACIALAALFLIPAAGLAWESARPGASGAEGSSGCPVMDRAGCPKSSGNELAQLAKAAEMGCPASASQLIERAKSCADEETAELARRAADGDEKAKVELIQRVRAVAPAPSTEPADPANAA